MSSLKGEDKALEIVLPGLVALDIIGTIMDKMQQFRQPMVTATGIFLGFMLDFAYRWLPNSFTVNRFRDTVVAAGTLVSIACLIAVLYRVLRMDYPEDNSQRYYKRTLRFFISGISFPFFSMIIIVMQKLGIHFF